MRRTAPRLTLLAVAVLAVAVLLAQAVRADEKETGTQPETSGPKNSVPPTNSQSFKPTQSGLKQLEQDLFKPFETISPKGSLDGAFVPPMPETRSQNPAAQKKKARENLERRRDWVFETPDEILATPSTDDLLNGRDEKKNSDDKSNLSPLERFYDRLYNKKNDKKSLTRKTDKRDDLNDSKKRSTLSDESDDDDDSDLPVTVRDTQREMRKLLTPRERKDDTSADQNRRLFSDVFGMGKATPSREELEMQRERIDRYKGLLGLPTAANIENDPLKQFRDIVGTSSKSPGFASTMGSSSALPGQNVFGTQPASALGASSLNLLPEGAQLHVTPSLAPALPKIEAPKSLPPPVSFSVPRRQF
jgi:hypothetical protein